MQWSFVINSRRPASATESQTGPDSFPLEMLNFNVISVCLKRSDDQISALSAALNGYACVSESIDR